MGCAWLQLRGVVPVGEGGTQATIQVDWLLVVEPRVVGRHVLLHRSDRLQPGILCVHHLRLRNYGPCAVCEVTSGPMLCVLLTAQLAYQLPMLDLHTPCEISLCI